MRRISTLTALTMVLSTAALFFSVSSTETQADESERATSSKKVAPAATPKVADTTAHIELAILLDTSGSMDGLINQARTHLWKIVNELATVKKDGKTPKLTVALYEYGKQSIPASEGYLRQISPLTDDLDKISEELFALKTNGGDEYCGKVIQSAVNGLQWSKGDKHLKLIYIAGNEAFTQGKVDYKTACKAAIKNGIVVNTIYCGSEKNAVVKEWRDGATLADGDFFTINQTAVRVVIATPYDKEISKLNSQVNQTYLFYGRADLQKEAKKNQLAQDANAAAAAPAAIALRTKFKGSGQYRAKADLIDALADKKVILDEIANEELPEELKKLAPKERKAYVEKKSKERTAIQQKIKELSKKRDAFVAAARRKEAGKKSETTFESVVVRSLQKQAAKKNFKAEK